MKILNKDHQKFTWFNSRVDACSTEEPVAYESIEYRLYNCFSVSQLYITHKAILEILYYNLSQRTHSKNWESRTTVLFDFFYFVRFFFLFPSLACRQRSATCEGWAHWPVATVEPRRPRANLSLTWDPSSSVEDPSKKKKKEKTKLIKIKIIFFKRYIFIRTNISITKDPSLSAEDPSIAFMHLGSGAESSGMSTKTSSST